MQDKHETCAPYGNIFHFKIVNYMKIFKWQIKSFVYSEKLIGMRGLRIYVILLLSSDFLAANFTVLGSNATLE